jgi:serine O-acetyltransferase
MNEAQGQAETRELWRSIRARHPRLRQALLADARITAHHRGERQEFRSRLDAAIQILRLAWVSDAFLAHALYRLKARLQALGVPVLPRLAHRLAMAIAQVSIGDPVVMHPGVYLIHGQVVIDGLIEIHPGAVIGTGAKLIGPVRVGRGARIGANAVVVDDVPEGATVVGVPGRRVDKR